MTLRTSMAALIAGLTLAGLALAAPFTSDWYTIDGGGGMVTGGSFTIHGTIGQADAGVALTGGSFALQGGFWAAPPLSACSGDINGDGSTNVFDFAILASTYGQAVTPWTNGDLNGSGIVNAADFNLLAVNWGCVTP